MSELTVILNGLKNRDTLSFEMYMIRELLLVEEEKFEEIEWEKER